MHTKDESRYNKYATTLESDLGYFTRQIISELNTPNFLEFLVELTGIRHLLGDSYRRGAGIHMNGTGAYLKVHADNNWDEHLRLDRRLNLILFTNPYWEDSFGGDLEFWNADMTKCGAKISPKFNRVVLFQNNDDANHGHPDPLKCPENIFRTTLALYYYTNGRPYNETSMPHTTIYKKRPGEQLDNGTIQVHPISEMHQFIPPKKRL